MAVKKREPWRERVRELEARLEEAEETLRAIRGGEVDAFVASGPEGEVVYTLQGADEGYRLFVERMAEGAVTLAKDGLVLFSNNQFAQMVDWPPERVIGSYLPEFVAPEERDVLKALLATSGSAKAELHLQRSDGGLTPAYFSCSLLRRNGTNCVALIVTNLTEQKRNEQLRASHERLRLLYESNILGIVAADTERIYEANDLFLSIVQYSRTELDQGLIRWREMTPPEYLPLDDKALEELRTRGSSGPFEKEYWRRDGSRVPIFIGATLLEPDPLRWICFILDLTERKKLERKLAEKQKLENIGMLAGGIAHDFNNLLVGILGNASLAQDEVGKAKPLADYLDAIVRCSQSAAHLTRQMLAYSGKGQFVIEPLNLGEVAQQAMKLLHSSIPGSAAVHLDLDPHLPLVEADAGQMQQVVMNLVMNAAEAIGEDPGVILVRAGSLRLNREYIHRVLEDAPIEPGEYVVLEVRDSGCGMDEETKAKIFDPFFTTRFTGRGLGLSAVAGIVRGHKGALQVNSAPGQGSSFTIYFPAVVQERRAEEAAPHLTEQAGAAGTVLVVDDEDIVLQTAKLALERHGYSVLPAPNGRTAIEILEREKDRVSLALLDSSMPDLSGQETLTELLRIKPDLEVLVSSGYAQTETMRLFAGQRVGGFVQKPYTPARLAERVKAALSRSPKYRPTPPPQGRSPRHQRLRP